MITEKFASMTVSAAGPHYYETAPVLFCGTEKTEEGFFLGVGKFSSGEKFIFRLDDECVGASSENKDYNASGIPLGIDNDDPGVVAAQLRELADWFDSQA